MNNHRLLVVLDDRGTLSALDRHFTRMGWHVRAAGTAAEGLALLDAGPEPCCLVLDLDLPDGRGETILENLRVWGLRTRVAVCSESRDQDRLRADWPTSAEAGRRAEPEPSLKM